MRILYAVLLLGGIGLLFGVLLTIAAKAFHVEVDERVQAVRDCLAGANCGACGFPGCDGCAEAIVQGKAAPNACPPAGEKAANEIARIMGLQGGHVDPMVARVLCQGTNGVAKSRYLYDGYKSCRVAAGIAGGPKECRFSCIGLGDCMDDCPFGAIEMKDGLAVIDEKLCRSCGKCVDACPRGVIKMMPLSAKVIVRCQNTDTMRVARQVCMHACIGCGRCVKECQYGAIVVENGYAHIDYDKCTRCGACAAVCPCKCITVE